MILVFRYWLFTLRYGATSSERVCLTVLGSTLKSFHSDAGCSVNCDGEFDGTLYSFVPGRLSGRFCCCEDLLLLLMVIVVISCSFVILFVGTMVSASIALARHRRGVYCRTA